MTCDVKARLALLDNILAYYEGKTFSQNEAEKVVGGEQKLISLIAQGKIEVQDKLSDTRTSKYRINARQCLENMRNFRDR